MHQAHDARPETSSLKAPPPSAPDFAGPAVDKPTCRPSLCQIWCPSPECPPPTERSRRRRVGRRFVASAAGGLLAGEAAALTMTSLVRVPPAEASSAGQLPLPDRGAPVPTTAWLVIGLDGTRRLAFGRDRPPPTLLCFFPSDSEPEVRARFRSDRIVCGNLANNAAGETSPLVAEQSSCRRGAGRRSHAQKQARGRRAGGLPLRGRRAVATVARIAGWGAEARLPQWLTVTVHTARCRQSDGGGCDRRLDRVRRASVAAFTAPKTEDARIDR